MTWSIAAPLWLFLPLSICLIVHGFLSAGFLLSLRKGLLRLLVYFISCCFLLAYFLVFNQNLILATTKVQIDFPNRYLKYENYYGAVRIPAEKIQAVAVKEGAETPTVWVQCEGQIFYLDQRFPRLNEFLPLLQSIASFSPPQSEYGYSVYRLNDYANILNLDTRDHMLAGGVKYYFPWLCVFTILAYPLAARAWQGKMQYFRILGLCYYVPSLVMCLFIQPSLPLAFFLLFYPVYILFLSAMCLPDNNQTKEDK